MKTSKKNLKEKPPSEKLLAIRAVKKALADVHVSAVAAHLNCTRANIYYHLNENNAENVSVPHLKKISDAIAFIKREQQKQLSELI